MDQPSVIVLSIDTLRYDCVPHAPDQRHLERAGARLPPLPALERITRGGVHFTQCVSSAPYTTVSHASMLTGLLPTQHGVRTFFASSLRDDVPTLAESLGSAGYATCLMSDRPELFRAVGLSRGFDRIAEGDAAAFDWWDANAGLPRLLVWHIFDVHQPYGFVRTADPFGDNCDWVTELERRCRAAHVPLPRNGCENPHEVEELSRYARQLCLRLSDRMGHDAALRLFVEGVERFDRLRLAGLVGELDRRGILDDAIVAVTSDHGEGRDLTGRHALAHAGLMLDEVIRVPLFVRAPGLPSATIDEQVGLIDLTPTLLELAGQPPPPATSHWLAGRSLVPRLHGQRLPPRPVYGEVWHCVRARDVPFVELTESEVHGAEYALRQRMLRWSDRKFTLIGHASRYGDDWRRLDAESFARRLYREILGRVEDAEGYAHLVRRLHTVRGRFRGRIFRHFEHSDEFAMVPKYCSYQLDHDPLELSPHSADTDPAAWHQFEQVLAVMDEIHELESAGGPLLVGEQAMESVVGRLRDLGYFE